MTRGISGTWLMRCPRAITSGGRALAAKALHTAYRRWLIFTLRCQRRQILVGENIRPPRHIYTHVHQSPSTRSQPLFDEISELLLLLLWKWMRGNRSEIYISKCTLSCTMCSTTRNTRNTRYSTTCSPGFSRRLHTSFVRNGIRLSVQKNETILWLIWNNKWK